MPLVSINHSKGLTIYTETQLNGLLPLDLEPEEVIIKKDNIAVTDKLWIIKSKGKALHKMNERQKLILLEKLTGNIDHKLSEIELRISKFQAELDMIEGANAIKDVR